MKCGISGSLTQELIDEERLNLQDLNRRDWYTQVFQVTKKINWIYEPSPVKNQKSTKRRRRARSFTGTSTLIDKLLRTPDKGCWRESIASGKS